MKEVELFTDGACSGNPGPGGWGAILRFGGREKELSGGEAQTTNNRMELTAAIEGLAALKESCRVTLCSDSRYLIAVSYTHLRRRSVPLHRYTPGESAHSFPPVCSPSAAGHPERYRR